MTRALLLSLCLLLASIGVSYSATTTIALSHGVPTKNTIASSSEALFFSITYDDPSATMMFNLGLESGTATGYVCLVNDPVMCRSQRIGTIAANGYLEFQPDHPALADVAIGELTLYILVSGSGGTDVYVTATATIVLVDYQDWSTPYNDPYEYHEWRYFGFFLCDNTQDLTLTLSTAGTTASKRQNMYVSFYSGRPDQGHAQFTDDAGSIVIPKTELAAPRWVYISVQALDTEYFEMQLTAWTGVAQVVKKNELYYGGSVCTLTSCAQYLTLINVDPKGTVTMCATPHIPGDAQLMVYVNDEAPALPGSSIAFGSEGCVEVLAMNIPNDATMLYVSVVSSQQDHFDPAFGVPSMTPEIFQFVWSQSSDLLQPSVVEDWSVALLDDLVTHTYQRWMVPFKNIESVYTSTSTVPEVDYVVSVVRNRAMGDMHPSLAVDQVYDGSSYRGESTYSPRGTQVYIGASDSHYQADGTYFVRVGCDSDSGAGSGTLTGTVRAEGLFRLTAFEPINVYSQGDGVVSYHFVYHVDDLDDGLEIQITGNGIGSAGIHASQTVYIPDATYNSWSADSSQTDTLVLQVNESSFLQEGSVYITLDVPTQGGYTITAAPIGYIQTQLQDGMPVYAVMNSGNMDSLSYIMMPDTLKGNYVRPRAFVMLDTTFKLGIDASVHAYIAVSPNPGPTNFVTQLNSAPGQGIVWTDLRVPTGGEVFIAIACLGDDCDTAELRFKIMSASYEEIDNDETVSLYAKPYDHPQFLYFTQHDQEDTFMEIYTSVETNLTVDVCFGAPPMQLTDDDHCHEYTFGAGVTDYIGMLCSSPNTFPGPVFVVFYPDGPEGAYHGTTLYKDTRLTIGDTNNLVLETEPQYYSVKLPRLADLEEFVFKWDAPVGHTVSVCFSAVYNHPDPNSMLTDQCELGRGISTSGVVNEVLDWTFQDQFRLIYGAIVAYGTDSDSSHAIITGEVALRPPILYDDVLYTSFEDLDAVTVSINITGAPQWNYYSLIVKPFVLDHDHIPLGFYNEEVEVFVSVSNPIPSAKDYDMYSLSGGVQVLYVDKWYLAGYDVLYVTIKCTQLILDRDQTYTVELDTNFEHLVNHLPWAADISVSDQIGGSFNHYAFESVYTPSTIIMTPCRGSPVMYMDTIYPMPTADSCQYEVEGKWGQEARFDIEPFMPQDINWFFSLSNDPDQTYLSNVLYSFELYAMAGDERPQPGNGGQVVVEKHSRGGATVKFAPASIQFQTSPDEVEYAIYGMIKTGTVTPENSYSPYTACGMLAGGVPLWTDSTGSEWFSYETLQRVFEKETNAGVIADDSYYLTVLAHSWVDQTTVAYTTVTVGMTGFSFTGCIIVMLIVGLVLAAGFGFTLYWLYLRKRRTPRGYYAITE